MADAAINMDSQRITGLAASEGATDGVNKAELDAKTDFYAESSGTPSVAPTCAGDNQVSLGDDNAIGADADGSTIIGGTGGTIDGIGQNKVILRGKDNDIDTGYPVGGFQDNYVGNSAQGYNNSITAGTGSDVSGDSNTVSDNDNTVFGGGNAVTGEGNFVKGSSNTVSGDSNLVTGTSMTVSGSKNGVFGGITHIISDDSCCTTGGENAVSWCENQTIHSYPHPDGGVNGGSQRTQIHVYARTTDATPEVADGSNNELTPVIMASHVVGFKGLLVARQLGGSSGTVGDCKMFEIDGMISRDDSNNTTLHGNSVTTKYSNGSVSNWAIAVTANDTLETLVITVTGEANKTIDWYGNMTTVEVA